MLYRRCQEKKLPAPEFKLATFGFIAVMLIIPWQKIFTMTNIGGLIRDIVHLTTNPFSAFRWRSEPKTNKINESEGEGVWAMTWALLFKEITLQWVTTVQQWTPTSLALSTLPCLRRKTPRRSCPCLRLIYRLCKPSTTRSICQRSTYRYITKVNCIRWMGLIEPNRKP